MFQHPRRSGRRFLLTLAISAAIPMGPIPLPAAESPAPSPASAADPALQKKITDAVDLLGSDDFAAREQAAKTLWAFGEAALPALREAAASDNPEVARRAKTVLRSFAYGVRPDTPKPVIEQLNAYQQGNVEQKKAAIIALTQLGANGARVLLKLQSDEQEPELKKMGLNALTSIARPSFAAMAAQGDYETGNRLLAAVAPQAEGPARDHAAFLLLHGGLEEAIDQLQRPGPNPAVAATQLRLACLLRAKGDLARAAEAANAAGERNLADSILAEAGEYARLAKEAEGRGVAEASIEDIGYVMAYHRLAGDAAAADKWIPKIKKFAHDNPGDHWNAVETLLLNERTDEAMALLAEQNDALLALEFAAARFDFKLADKLVAKAKEDGRGDLGRVLAKYAPLLHHQGKNTEAFDLLKEVINGDHGAVDSNVWQDVLEAAPLSGVPIEQLDKWLAQSQNSFTRPGEKLDRLFFRARLVDPERAQQWWVALRDHRMNLTPNEAAALIRRLDRGQVPAEELTTLVDKLRELARTLPIAERPRRLALVADVLADRERIDEAITLYEQILIQGEKAATHLRIGELHAKAKRWDKAAEAFAKARESDPSDPKPVALEGWALTQQGKAEEGKRLMDLAHLMPLGDEMARNALAETLAKHDLKDEARREREICVRLGDPRAWSYADALRRLAAEKSKTDPLAAAAMWDRAFLSNFSIQTSFVDPTANLTIPVLIRRSKAIGHIRAGKVAEGLADAKVCLEAYPADADSQIAVVRELDKAGKKPEAEQVYRAAFDRYDAIRKAYPDSAQANNLVAWMSGCVKRDLDHALTCAKKGIELEPENTAILDTLSEVLFARGEYDEALKVNEQCRSMEPFIEHHKKNLERFKAAKEGKGKDSTSPAVEEE